MIEKKELKKEAIELRKQGLSYSEILNKVKVAKSTLSEWLRSVELAKKQRQLISEKRIAGRLRAIQSIRRNKIKRVSDIKDSAIREVPRLIRDPFWLAGVILYWGEGSKEHIHACPVKFTNMDLQMHRLFLSWLRKYFAIKDDQLVFQLFIHEKADVEKAQRFWMKNLCFTEDKLRIYFKKHNPKTKRKHIGEGYHGVLSTIIYKSIPFNRRIAGWIEGVVVYLNRQNMS